VLGDFNAPGFDWNYGLPSPDCHFFSKLEGDLIHSAICFLNLNQHNYPNNGSNLLDLVFSPPNSADLAVDHAEYGPVQPDHFHSFFIIDCAMPVRRYKHNFNISYKRFSAGDDAVLCNALCTCDCSSLYLYNETSVDDAVERLNVAVTQTIGLAVPSVHFKEKNYFYRRHKKCKAGCFYDKLSFYRKLVNAAIKTDRFYW
jgi:hypothetical protein